VEPAELLLEGLAELVVDDLGWLPEPVPVFKPLLTHTHFLPGRQQLPWSTDRPDIALPAKELAAIRLELDYRASFIVK